MAKPWETHIDSETLEGYAKGVLSEADSNLVEEHLLLCELCRQQLVVAEEFIAGLRAADEISRPIGEAIKG